MVLNIVNSLIIYNYNRQTLSQIGCTKCRRYARVTGSPIPTPSNVTVSTRYRPVHTADLSVINGTFTVPNSIHKNN